MNCFFFFLNSTKAFQMYYYTLSIHIINNHILATVLKILYCTLYLQYAIMVINSIGRGANKQELICKSNENGDV